MKCYNHHTRDAVGICTKCGKAICTECSTLDAAHTLTCKERCTAASSQDIGTPSRSSRINYPVVIFLLAIAAIVFLPRYASRKENSHRTTTPSPRSVMYDRIELGLENTFFMDDSVLETRNIYFNYDFNELTCGWLVKTLWLLDRKSNEPINLYLCSSGGFISEAIAIENTIKSLTSKVNTFATGYCASSALRTLAAGTGVRAAYCNTILMFHGKSYENGVKRSYDAVARETERKDWLRISTMPEKMLSDTTDLNMSPEKAREFGFIDTVICF